MAISIVQSASGNAAATSLTVTLTSPVTAGNTICASLGIEDGETSSYTVALTLGGSPDNWGLNRHVARTLAGTETYYAGAWSDPDCAGGADTVTVTLTGATGDFGTAIILQVYEVAGIPAAEADITGALSGGKTTSWSTGAFTPTAGTTAADEFWWGCVAFGGVTATGPPGWTNTGTLTSELGSALMSGYQITTATGEPDYEGTFSLESQYCAAGATLKAGTASGTASMAGAGDLAASAGIEGEASPEGEGTLTAAAVSGPPDSSGMAGQGTLAALGTTDVEAAADLSGSGALAAQGGAAPVNVVNQWSGTTAQNPVFGPSLPALHGVTMQLDHASSVGGGTGIPSAGNWLFALVGWRQAPGSPAVTISVGDDTPDWWRCQSPSAATGNTRTVIWYTAGIGQVTTVPGYVYVAPNGYCAGMSVLVIEVANIGAWDTVSGVETAYDASSESLSLSVTFA